MEGLTGFVSKPIRGAKEDGVGGFFKGVGKGTIGLVARPAAGVVDFASGSFDAVKKLVKFTNRVNLFLVHFVTEFYVVDVPLQMSKFTECDPLDASLQTLFYSHMLNMKLREFNYWW